MPRLIIWSGHLTNDGEALARWLIDRQIVADHRAAQRLIADQPTDAAKEWAAMLDEQLHPEKVIQYVRNEREKP